MSPGIIQEPNGHANGFSNASSNGVDAHMNGTTNGTTNGHSEPASSFEPNGLSNGASNHVVEPVAIVGMAMRLPGGVHDAEGFWDLLVNKRNGQCRVPADRYNIDAWYKPGKAGHVGTQYGYFLEDLDLAHIDASFWSMTKHEAEAMDPQQRLILEVVYECLENAGERNWRGKNIGCYVGVFGEDWIDMDSKDVQNHHMYRLIGYGDYITANRVSYEFDFKGPSMTIRTACSSSLTGLHEACQALYNGDCKSAIVGGTNIIITPRMTIAMTEQGVISPTGSCKSFDANADGYARGEAVSALYIKKLSDAVRDGDTIRAVIRSTCVNNDGKTVGITSPSTEAHETLIRRGHQLAGITDLSKTAMIECHGTGTKIGDPIETSAVANVFGEHGIYIGSVKPNLGHSEGASGMSSVIKMVLALEHKTIPPNINFKKPNPNIPWEQGKLKVPIHATPWPADRAERVGVNSFGIGGANAHVLLESAAAHGLDRPAPPVDVSEERPNLLVFSATHPESLRRLVDNHASYLGSHTDSLNDMSYTLSTKRQPLSHRAFCIASEDSPLEPSRINKPTETPNLVFAFTGQGAQWAQMGRELFSKERSFSDSIRGLDKVLSSLPEPPQWTLEDEILKPKSRSRLSEAELSQPCCTAIQVALVDLMTKWDIKPAGVVGHSSGEIGAAYASGVLTAEEAILVAYYRGLATLGLGKIHRGGMAAIGLGRDQVTQYLRTGVIIGCENSQSSTTLTGDIDTLEQIMATIQEDRPEVLVRALHVECAYHSHHMKTVEAKYRTLLGKAIHAKEPTVPFYSSVTGGLLKNGEILSTSYWVQNLTSPVLFLSAVSAIIGSLSQPLAFLEIGPHSALAGPIRQIIRKEAKDAHYVSTLVRNEDALTSLLKTAGELWISNVDVNFDSVNPPGEFLTDLPTYPWNYDGQYWYESRLSKEWRLRKFPHHDLLGARLVETSEVDPTWRNMLRLDNVPWIQDHEIAQDILLPAAGYIAMIGEAIRQLTDLEDYTVRAVDFISALIMNEGKPVEVQTHLRKARLTTTLDSEWYEFSIASLNGTTWIKHCVGQVRGGAEFKLPVPTIEPCQRKVPTSTWYRVMARFGLNYGPRFRGLSEISAHVSERKAVATLNDSLGEKETPYQLHPATLDSSFQLFSCAAFNGVGRLFTKLSIPTHIEEFYIKPAKESIAIQAEAESSPTGTLAGNLVGVSAGELVMNLKGLKMTPLGDNNEGQNDDPHAAVELEWKSDVNLLDATQLMRPAKDITKCHLLVEKLALACMIESIVQLQGVQTTHPHLDKFRAWLDTRREMAIGGQYPNIDDCAMIAGLDSTQRTNMIENLLAQSLDTEAAAVATAIHRISKHSRDIFLGTTDPLDILMEDDILTKVYDFMQLWDYTDFFELLGHYKPDMKILEIGAGTGGTTSTIIPHLKSAYGERMFGSYKYTDISAGFFVAAKERFKDVQGLDYAILDVSQDPIQQGFEPESFDLIVATNVLHATPKLSETLSNVRKLLHPHGRLFLQELDPSTRWINYVMGVLPGWWLGEDDDRPLEPYVNPERWDKELKSAGFGGVDAVAYDGHLLNNIIAMPAREEKSKRITILSRGESSQHSRGIIQQLRERSFELDFCTLDQVPKPGQDIVSLLDTEAPFLYSATEESFSTFKSFVSHIQGAGVLWVTEAAQNGCRDPNYSLILGMARTIRTEFLMDFATLELESFDDAAACKATADVLQEFQHRVRDQDNDPVLEYAFSDGRVQVGRYHWVSVSKELLSAKHHSYPRKLEIGRPGILHTLAWRQQEPFDLKGDFVEIETRAVGLNFKDVLMSMGIVDLVKRVGPEVKHLKVGDRVLCCTDGSFSTTWSMSELFCAKMSDSLSFVEAATIPLVYGTVIAGLMDCAKLSKGQTVLIHSACGGVGIAAVQIAKMIGAEIFCTVGNQEKVDFLMQNFNIPRNRIFNSRDTSFLRDVLRETGGKGVNVVLNSLSGELLHSSWKCVADFGTMVEIGKRDFIGNGNLAMNLFENNRSFIGLDLSQICFYRPNAIHDLLRRAMEFYEQGYIKPITPMKEFEAAHIEDAMRYMQKGQHIGKIVVTFPKDPMELEATADPKELVLRPDVSYLSIGGLGGLGRSIASWMVERGARHLIFFSRSAGSVTSEDPYIKELAALGCSVQTFSGSVSNLSDVKRVISSAAKPIAGVLQASMVLSDAALGEMTFEQWQTALLPKVQGTWNLHEALLAQKQSLDFFFLFSSVSGVGGQWGQANYAAGNTFLDAFVQYRHSLGLPASVLDIGAMEDVGYLSQNSGILEALRATSLHTLHEQDLLDSLQLMIDRSLPAPQSSPMKTARYVNPSQVAIGVRSTLPLSAPNNRTIWKKDPRMAVYRNLESLSATSAASSGNDEGLKQFLRDASKNPALLDLAPSIEYLAKEAGTTLFGFMMRSDEEPSMDVPLASLGVDSLVSIELRNWFRQKVGAEFTVLEVVNSNSITHLGEQAAAKLKEKFQARQ
ncbi:hypothetical protein HO133_003441 [Letharia lupina]|uniref:Carrier domain-containing protein n=1 Tax=Letharia lupina TaxID=560253 RepID=A0A8H6FA70_9LECA|nr:uncharacterized protein HO133_003441 [Letharia lupina]KAF6220309.1 hypothetical protein HO133_003441 [Letharia lupina]